MLIRLADKNDLNDILAIYESARCFMRNSGNPNQWGENNPPRSKTEEDIEQGCLYAVEDENILAVFYFNIGDDPTYEKIYEGKWLNNEPYGVIHRIAVSDAARGKGIASACFDYAFKMINNVKIDTHEDNLPMQRALLKYGFTKCGIIHLANGDKRIAFQKQAK